MTLHMKDITGDAKVDLFLDHKPVLQGNSSIYTRFFKRLFDVIAVVVALPIVVLLIIVMAVLVALDGHSPFYSQKRVGRHGRVFRLWKIRTMIPNADTHLEDHLRKNPAARREWDATQKLKRDPRITPIGHILRKSSLDELPQLWNVLTGSMSLVGPRPMMVSQQDKYPGYAYYTQRPGITGLWQISDRNECDFANRASFDDDYARNVSSALDLQILYKTVGVVVRATGH